MGRGVHASMLLHAHLGRYDWALQRDFARAAQEASRVEPRDGLPSPWQVLTMSRRSSHSSHDAPPLLVADRVCVGAG